MVMLHSKDLHLFYGVLRFHQLLLLTLILVKHMPIHLKTPSRRCFIS